MGTMEWERLRKRRSQNYHFRDLQTTANDIRKAERLDFLQEMQSQVITDCDNSSGTEYKTSSFRRVHSFKKRRKRTEICLKSCICSK